MMAQKLQQASASSSGSSYTGCKANPLLSDQFPAGLRVLVVDDDTTCLKILEQMLRRCLYTVTLCSQATVALKLLRERKGCYDVVLSDVHMPDMDGYKLLEHVGLEMDLPVIMMSGDGSTGAVMRGIRHGACDYLIKPVREEELKNIWQHVVRKKWNENKELEHSGSLDDTDRQKQGNDDSCYASSIIEGAGSAFRGQKHNRDSKEEDDSELENADQSSSKKPRVVWSVELHQQFVSAVNQLGLDKAVPKRILELMNVPGLTRENVASHLQKFRLYLKRLSGVAQQGGISNPFCGPGDPNMKYGSLGRFDIQALAASGQIPSPTLAALHAELLGQPVGNLSFSEMDRPVATQGFFQRPKTGPADQIQGACIVQHPAKCQPDASKLQTLISNEVVHSGFGAWPSNGVGSLAPGRSSGSSNTQNAGLFADFVRKQYQQQPVLADTNGQVMVQPSCLVVPSQTSADFQTTNPIGYNYQTCSFTGSLLIDSNILNQSSSYTFSAGQHSGGDLKSSGILNYSAQCSAYPSISSCLGNDDGGNNRKFPITTTTFAAAMQQPEFVRSTCSLQGSYSSKADPFLGQGSLDNVGKLSSFPSRFAVEMDQTPQYLNRKKVGDVHNGTRVKREPDLDFMENARLGVPELPQCPSSDLMRVVSE